MDHDNGFQDVFYPPFHESELTWGVVITTVGLQSIAPNTQYPPPGHPQGYAFNPQKGRILNEIQLVYISKGSGTFSTKTNSGIKLEEGSLFALFPGMWHTYKPGAEGWDTYWVGIKGDYAERMVEQLQFSEENPVQNIGYQEEVVRLFRKIIDEARNEKIGSQQLMGGIASHLLGFLFQFQKQENSGNKMIISKINKAKMIIREKYLVISPEDLANDLGISYSWFRRAFKQHTGFAPAQYVLQLKVQSSRRLAGL